MSNIPDVSETPDPRPGFYYVSTVDGPRSARVRGPFTLHELALAAVDPARAALCDLIPYAWFYAFGTCRSETDLGPGYLDAHEAKGKKPPWLTPND